jgi:hypothetical protein
MSLVVESIGESVRVTLGDAVVELGVREAEEAARTMKAAAAAADAAWQARVNEGAPAWGERIEWTDLVRPGCFFVGTVSEVHRGLIYAWVPCPDPGLVGMPGYRPGGLRHVIPVSMEGRRSWRVIAEDDHRCAVCGAVDTILVGPARECAAGNSCCSRHR